MQKDISRASPVTKLNAAGCIAHRTVSKAVALPSKITKRAPSRTELKTIPLNRKRKQITLYYRILRSRARHTCLEPAVKSCSVDMTVKCTGPKSKPYHGVSAIASPASPGMRNLTKYIYEKSGIGFYGAYYEGRNQGCSLHMQLRKSAEGKRGVHCVGRGVYSCRPCHA